MTTESGAPVGESAAPATGELSIQDAMAMIDAGAVNETFEIDGEAVKKPTENTNPEQAREQPRAAEQNPSQEEEADPEEAPREEQTNEADPQDQPEPIEPPRSWTKEAKERWASLPRETQDYLAQREQERDRGLRQSQNEIAEQRKAIEAERQAMQALKQQYETKLPNLTKTLEEALQNEFADIKSMADVRKMQAEDPFRFQTWQLRQMELQGALQEQQEFETRRQAEIQSAWGKHVQDESAKFVESLSEADQKRIDDLNKAAPKFLMDRGFSQEELNALASGRDKLSVYDHRVQSLILDGMKYRDLQNAPKAVAPKNLPPVQKPGSANAASPQDANIRTLEQRLNKSGSMEDAWALYEAQLKQSNRRAS